ncbi:unnamed protein product [Closterium sp. NIES-53]
MEKLARRGPPEGSARETATGRRSGVSVVRSRKKEREAPESRVSPTRDLSGVRELVTPRVRQAAEAALGGVQAPALLTSAVASAEDVGAGTSTPTSLTPSVPLTKLLGGRGLTTALLLLALTATGATPLRRAATRSTAASAASAASATSATSAPAGTATASSASTAAADTSTPATTPTTTPTPTTVTTTTSTVGATLRFAFGLLSVCVHACVHGMVVGHEIV